MKLWPDWCRLSCLAFLCLALSSPHSFSFSLSLSLSISHSFFLSLFISTYTCVLAAVVVVVVVSSSLSFPSQVAQYGRRQDKSKSLWKKFSLSRSCAQISLNRLIQVEFFSTHYLCDLHENKKPDGWYYTRTFFSLSLFTPLCYRVKLILFRLLVFVPSPKSHSTPPPVI